MARKRKAKTLSPAHYRVIGHIAARWTQIETAMLDAIAKMMGLHIQEVIILAAPAAFASWVDMLIVVSRETKGQEYKEEELEKLCGLLLKLQRLRNYIVHAGWIPRDDDEHAAAEVIVTGSDEVKAFGIPKRGREVMVFVKWTVPQMRKVCALIDKCRIMLLEISRRPPATSPEVQRVLARKGRTNLRRIRAMLDTLPDPFRL